MEYFKQLLVSELRDARQIRQALAYISRPAIVGKCLVGLGACYLIYMTVKIWWQRRKYRHIPGPNTRG